MVTTYRFHFMSDSVINLSSTNLFFSVNGQVINILGFADFVIPTQPCLCTVKASIDNKCMSK